VFFNPPRRQLLSLRRDFLGKKMAMVFFWEKCGDGVFFWGEKCGDGGRFGWCCPGLCMLNVYIVYILTHSGGQLIEFTVVKGSFYI